MTPSFDPGLTQSYTGRLLRAINKDGTFNVHRTGTSGLAGSVYQLLTCISWPKFFLLIGAGYVIVNLAFAWIYTALGPSALHSAERDMGMSSFALAFYFSVQTLTTVGYGSLYPYGNAAHIVAAIESALGLLGFALATGILFARFSRPSARLVFSEGMVIAPYQDRTSLQFRVANRYSNILMEVEASVMVMLVERGSDGQLKRNFLELPLERAKILFLALSWTVVHPIDNKSPLWNLSADDLRDKQAEVLILLKGFDETFGQTVHTRYSYRWDEIQWGARFTPAFQVSEAGQLVLDVAKIGDTTPIA